MVVRSQPSRLQLSARYGRRFGKTAAIVILLLFVVVAGAVALRYIMAPATNMNEGPAPSSPADDPTMKNPFAGADSQGMVDGMAKTRADWEAKQKAGTDQGAESSAEKQADEKQEGDDQSPPADENKDPSGS